VCFYLYAPKNTINVVYKSEVIVLEADGTSSIVADCLIENTSAQLIDKINIIYPNVLHFFSNISHSLLEDTHINSTYDDFCGKTVQSPDKNHSWADSFAIHLSDPHDNCKTITYQGLINNTGIDVLERDANLTNDDHNLLRDHYYTVLSYNFRKGVPQGQRRWIRLKFDDIETAKTSEHAKHQALLKLTNNLTYHYQVLGPHSVKNNFLRKLQQLSADLVNYFNGHGLIDGTSSTVFGKMRLQAHPGKMERFTHYNNIGNIITSGNFPKFYILSNKKYYTYYQWEITDGNNAAFLLDFQAKPFYLPYYLLSVAGIIIASTGLTFTITLTIFRALGYIH
jgi:hypothetical protein